MKNSDTHITENKLMKFGQADLCLRNQEKLLQPLLGWAEIPVTVPEIVMDTGIVGLFVGVRETVAAAEGEDHRCHHHVKTLHSNCFYL